jgi:hypothetical protein
MRSCQRPEVHGGSHAAGDTANCPDLPQPLGSSTDDSLPHAIVHSAQTPFMSMEGSDGLLVEAPAVRRFKELLERR